ncbi:putative DNA binding domain-containing protein [Marichromatium gracile]|uniref:RNA-binding domain-containing protein n=1 Tax=Marichromatium gracile TaxID=1048 RepID=UPI001F26A7AA|nr:RNA-binding domain-containing protein [Marichromatium gracile]MCF1182219.1 putative DNA binding domain-containing protein [Marichromatium gracile]
MNPLSLLHLSSGPIRNRLLRDLILLVAGTVGLLVLINVLLIDDIKHDLAGNRIESASALVRDEVRGLLLPVQQQLLIVRDGMESAGLGPLDEQALNERLTPILAHMPQVAGAIEAGADGAEYFLGRTREGWLTRVRDPEDPQRLRITRWDAQLKALETREQGSDYDPRDRPWYRNATAHPDTQVWSAPYIFASLGLPGTTVAIAREQAGELRVSALDVTLERIVGTIEGLDLPPGGYGFLFNGDGGVFVPSPEVSGSHASDRAASFFSAHERLGGPLAFDAVAAWKDADRPADGLVRFRSGGRDWWGGFRPLTDHPEGAWVAVALPVSATLTILQSRWHIVALTAFAILAASLTMASVVVRKYSRQLRDLPRLTIDRRHPQQDLRELIRSGEGAHLEFKSTMRMNLHTKTPGKEIELAWLKGVTAFLNTEGGILLMGVADDGTLLGMDADKFENDDKCQLHFKNLLNQHLGPEYARYVRFFLLELDGVRLGAVECERADAPVFLHDDKKRELFIIRSGPSNIELSISRALKYIRTRF